VWSAEGAAVRSTTGAVVVIAAHRGSAADDRLTTGLITLHALHIRGPQDLFAQGGGPTFKLTGRDEPRGNEALGRIAARDLREATADLIELHPPLPGASPPQPPSLAC
jgi:hypothetical protein